MPRVRPLTAEMAERQRIEQSNRMIRAIVKKYMVLGGYRYYGDCTSVCGITRGVFYKRMANPQTLTFDEMRGICRGLKIPFEEIAPHIL